MIYIIYILIVIILGVLYQAHSPNCRKWQIESKSYLILVFLLGLIIMGLRGLNVGKDTINYYIMYAQIVHLPINQLLSRSDVEPLWAILMWFNNYFLGNYLSFQLFISIIICLLSGILIYRLNSILGGNHILVLTILLISYFFLWSLNISRQIIAVLLVANSWIYYRSQNFYKSFFIYLCALGFHYSSLLALPLYVMWNLRRNRYLFFIFSIGLIGLIGGIEILKELAYNNGLYVSYTNADTDKFQEANTVRIMWVLIGLISTFIIMRKSKYSITLRVSSAFSLIYVTLNFLASEVSYIERIGLYYLPFALITLVGFGNKFKSSIWRLFYFSSLILCYTAWYMISAKSSQYIYKISEFL